MEDAQHSLTKLRQCLGTLDDILLQLCERLDDPSIDAEEKIAQLRLWVAELRNTRDSASRAQQAFSEQLAASVRTRIQEILNK